MTSPVTGRARLRLICTTDLHLSLCAFDFHRDRAVDTGLEALVPLIDAARGEEANCLLLDNGDAIQGTPIAQWLMSEDAGGHHPMIAAFNALGYDAATLGNHEFDFGIPAVERAYAEARFPVVCANVVRRKGASPLEDTPFFPPIARLERSLEMADGSPRTIRIGLVGTVPPRVTAWHRRTFDGVFEVRRAEDAAAFWARALRQDCDLVIALAHAGLVPAGDPHEAEQAARLIARIPEVDAVIAGHQHYAFPGPGWPEDPDFDVAAGRVAGTPLVMALSHGRAIGVVDLDLEAGGNGWQVTGNRCELRRVERFDGPGRLEPHLAPVRAGTRAYMAEVIGETDRPLETHFASLVPTDAVRFLHAVHLAAVADLDLPDRERLLSATSAFKAGQAGGYTSIPPGPVRRRACSDLCPFENHIVVLSVTGAELRDWVEQAAIHYARVTGAGGPLLDPDVPGFNFDTFSDLTFRVDLSAPAKFGTAGELRDPQGRVDRLLFRGEPVEDDLRYTVVTNSYRAAGGGGYRMLPALTPLWTDDTPFADRIEATFRRLGAGAALPRLGWTLTAAAGAEAVFETDAGASAVPEGPYAMVAAEAPPGRQRFRIRF